MKNDKLPRLLEFDVIKVLAIFLVLWGHAIMHFTSEDQYSFSAYQFIYSFHMPLFMMLSGFFSASSMRVSFKELFYKKFWRLIYPAISFGLIFLGVNLLWDYFADYKGNSVNGIKYMWGIFWFLKSLFVCYIVLYLCLKLCDGRKLPASIIAIVFSQECPLFMVNWMLPFFVLGYLFSYNFSKFLQYKKLLFAVSLLAFAICLHYYDAACIEQIQEVKQRLLLRDLGAITDLMKIQMSRFLIGFAGSVMVISGVSIIVPCYRNSPMMLLFAKYGGQTLGIYILQTLILEIIGFRLIDLRGMNTILYSYIVCPLASLFVMALCIFILKWIKPTPVLNKLLWGKLG